MLVSSTLACCCVAHASTPLKISLPGITLLASHQVEAACTSLLYGRTGQVKGIDLPAFVFSNLDQLTGLQLGIFPILPLINFKQSFSDPALH